MDPQLPSLGAQLWPSSLRKVEGGLQIVGGCRQSIFSDAYPLSEEPRGWTVLGADSEVSMSLGS